MSFTTIDITDDEIEALATEAGAAGDILMAAICRRALGEGPDSYARFALDPDERAKVDAMTREEAMAEVREVIAAAEAMAD